MKKSVQFIILASIILLQLSFISALDISVNEKEISPVAIIELNQPAIFELEIENYAETAETLEIYSLVGINIEPKEPFIVGGNSTKIVTLKAYPRQVPGYFSFEYKIKNSQNEMKTSSLAINIVNLKDAFKLSADDLNPASDEAIIYFENKGGFNFDNMQAEFSCAFFNSKQIFSINAGEKKQFSVLLNKEKMKSLVAGPYILTAKIKVEGKTAEPTSLIRFTEQADIETKELTEGFLLQRQEITKENKGNVPESVEIIIKKNLFGGWFTYFNIAPTNKDTVGFNTFYIFEKIINPGETLEVIAKTNWWLLIIIVCGIITAVYLSVKSATTKLKIIKRVSFVKTKGGEFALKISLILKAKDFVERIKLIDRLPGMVKLYERYGTIVPDKIDERNKRLEWNVENLNKNEERVFSYIIYSKIGIVGRFELPQAEAIYEFKGKVKEATSNKAFFINEPEHRRQNFKSILN